MLTIKDTNGIPRNVADLRSGHILFTENIASGYNFVKGDKTKIHWSVDSGPCIFYPDEIRLEGEVTDDVMKTLIYIA